MLKAIKINPKDNVAVVPQNVEAGQTVQVVETSEVFTATEFIKAGHKMALSDFQKDDTVIKYGIPIGKMKLDAPKGSWNPLPQCGGHHGPALLWLLRAIP